MKTFISAWIIAAVIIFIINMDFQNRTATFHGIAESQEIVINSEHHVEIQQIYVLPGQRVRRGDLLVELYRGDLGFQMNEITHRMQQIESQNVFLREEVSSRINQLELQKRSVINQYSAQINELEAQYRMNRLLSSELQSVERADTQKSTTASPLSVRIENLNREMKYALNLIDAEINLLRSQLRAGPAPSMQEFEKLENELSLVQDEKILLNVHSPIDGVIGSVNFREGEKIPSFSPMITLSSASPSYIKGYIHENAHNRVSVDDKVEIVAVSNPNNSVIGTVSGVGSRIVAFPERLRKTPDLLLWGREVTIAIPENSPFILGEKTLIRSISQRSNIFSTLKRKIVGSEAFANKPDDSAPTKTKIGGFDKDENIIEASGVVHIKNSDSYLIVSDESKTPHVIKINGMGEFEEFIPIVGVKEVNDMEEIAAINDSTFVIICSQSFNRRGHLRDERKWLLKVVLRKNELVVKNSIHLYDFLYNQAKANDSQQWAQFFMLNMQNNMPSIDIEAVAFIADTMLLGFKSPLLEKEKSIILYVANYQNIFTPQSGNAKIGVRNEFVLQDGKTRNIYGISGFYINNDKLYITATSFNRVAAGGVWVMNLNENSSKNIKMYESLRPEGIVFNHTSGNFVMVHDMGNDGSYMTILQ